MKRTWKGDLRSRKDSSVRYLGDIGAHPDGTSILNLLWFCGAVVVALLEVAESYGELVLKILTGRKEIRSKDLLDRKLKGSPRKGC